MKQKTWRRPVAVKEAEAVEPIIEQAAPAPVAAWRPHAWRVLAVWIIALATYSNSFGGGLAFDNEIAIGHDTRVHAFTSRNLHLILNEELWYNSSTSGAYRPLFTFSLLVNYALFGNGTNTTGYHIVNFAIHAANILLVYVLGLLLLEETTLAWALAGVWGVHPLLTESVTNIVGRADLLAAFGVLAGLVCHVQAARSTGRRQLGWLAGLALAAGIGMFSKENAVVLPAIMLLYDLTWARSAPWKERWKGYVAMALPFGLFFKLRADMLAHQVPALVPFLDNPLIGSDFWSARLTAVKVIGKYVGLFLWPARFSADYSYNAIPIFGWRLDRWEDVAAILALAGCLTAAALAIRFYRTAKPVFFFILFFFIALAPVANIVMLIGTIMGERLVYLPSVGLAGCLVVLLFTAARRLGAPKAAWAAVILLCGACSVRTFVRNFDWRDELRLGRASVAAAPGSFKTHQLLASAMLNARPPDVDGAARQAESILRILDPLPLNLLLARPYDVVGQAFRQKGDSLAPPGKNPALDSPSAFWYRKALAALLRGDEADRGERERIRTRNLALGKFAFSAGWVDLYLELGRVYRRLGEPQKALDAYADGRLRRADEEFSEEMSLTRLAMGEPQQAAVPLLEGLVLNPNSTRLASDVVEIYRQKAPDTCAISKGTNNINLECPLVHDQLCAASRNIAVSYAAAGRQAKAAETARTAIQSLACPAQLFR